VLRQLVSAVVCTACLAVGGCGDDGRPAAAGERGATPAPEATPDREDRGSYGY
jgi:hypothetical protein